MNVYGSIDEKGDDLTVYDYVILTADVKAVQSIFEETIKNYQIEPLIEPILNKIMRDSIGPLKIAPDYKVSIKLFKL